MSQVSGIETIALTKRYGQRVAVENIDLCVKQGEIYGFLGPNGSGKTTTIMMMVAVLPPSQGKIFILGEEMRKDATALRKRIGMVSEHIAVYGDMTALDYLQFFAKLYGVKHPEERIRTLLESVELSTRTKSILKEYSRGMHQKLALVRALLHDPDVLIMDEPASGLDPSGIAQVRKLIRDQAEKGKTVFLSSHILSEIEHTADRIGILSQGRLVVQGSVAEVLEKMGAGHFYLVQYSGSRARVIDCLEQIPHIRIMTETDTGLRLKSSSDMDLRFEISQAVHSGGGVVLSIEKEQLSLEEAFMRATGMITSSPESSHNEK